jgi:hypothetical protein
MREQATKSATIAWMVVSVILGVMIEFIVVEKNLSRIPDRTLFTNLLLVCGCLSVSIPALASIKLYLISRKRDLLEKWGGASSTKLLNDYSMFVVIAYSAVMMAVVTVAG